MQNQGIDERLFRYIADSIGDTPYYKLLGIQVGNIGPGLAELSVTVDLKHTNPLGVTHGGLMMSLADAAMGNAIRSLGIKAVTVDCSTGFISSAQQGETVIARGEVLRAGKNMLFAQAEVRAGNRLLSNSKASYFKTGEMDLNN
ncbi:MAG: PaaI family thioesterase [Syntrophomonas sp.]|uniref:PaaI family thioesterase n=1 Tax=Syntrophomonas sp. TaxID=2053627 RepID=UPI0026328E61|nr:PaaI family thioesterase [Syntrophomonas sp.]MDD2509754.1 PaaI family thioesterase [Syntrophomonas sp.]MDD3879502.1 PaaI family thioesterase [Syntrophomonas sp.]MDD4625753.1 PaaI family thioesterase [Syntrophomonas sp.]